MIVNFWNWIGQSVSFALSTLSTFINNIETGPFFDLLLVIFLMGCLMHFIIKPLIGGISNAGKSDKVKGNTEEE